MPDPIPQLIAGVDERRLRANLFHLSKDPLPFRKLNFTRPGCARNTLYEADDFIQAQLESWGYAVEKEGARVQCFRCDTSKPKERQYSPPPESDPWHTAFNLYAKKRGAERPDEIIVVVSHKDSPSWVDSPGAYDNAVGTVGNLEIARVLAGHETRRSVWFLFCNEEHRPWTSVTAAQNAAARRDKIIAVFNVDSIGGKSKADVDAGRKTNVTLYTTPEGRRLAEVMVVVNTAYGIGLEQSLFERKQPGDDDGSFIKAGFRAAIANCGSCPYADPNYHRETDIPEAVDVPNVRMAAQATLAAVLRVDQE